MTGHGPRRRRRIACAGDSLTAGFGAAADAAYPARLQALLGPGFLVRNFGVIGATVRHDAVRLGEPCGYIHEVAFCRSMQFRPDIVLLMLGTNDAKPENQPSDEAFLADYAVYITAYQSLSSPPLLIPATPAAVCHPGWGIEEAAVGGRIAPLIRRLAMEKGLPLADIHAHTVGKPSLYTSDGIHCNAEGYAHIAARFANIIQEQEARWPL